MAKILANKLGVLAVSLHGGQLTCSQLCTGSYGYHIMHGRLGREMLLFCVYIVYYTSALS